MRPSNLLQWRSWIWVKRGNQAEGSSGQHKAGDEGQGNHCCGEKAEVAFETGEVKVIGNVRYIGPEVTLYGTELKFNFKNGELTIQNARVQSENYIVLGKEIKKVDKKIHG